MISRRTFWAMFFVIGVAVAGSALSGMPTSTLGEIFFLGKDFSGEVVNSVGIPVVGAKVHLVPASAINMAPITASEIYYPPYRAESYDEPLEDAIRVKGTEFPNAITDTEGKFIIPEVPDGKFFVHVTPAERDAEHLPGGDRSRIAYEAESLRGTSVTIKVSSRPPIDAIYVGSSTCLSCHPKLETLKQTGHKLSLTVPGAPGRLQDHSKYPDYFKSLPKFKETDRYTDGTRLELGDYDPARGSDKFKIREFSDTRLPIDTVYFDVYLWKSRGDGKYYITIANRLNPGDPDSPAHMEVKLLYGGAVHRQRFIVSVPPNLGERKGWYVVLHFNPDGSDERLNRERRVWEDFYLSQFWDPGRDGIYGTADDVIKAPPVNSQTFQTMCAACHVTGWERYMDPATGQYLVRGVNDPGGELNIDDDPEMDEINIGCEKCHGPGSKHTGSPGRYIVNPKLLSSERSSVICGRCHDRRQGHGGEIDGIQPINEKGEFIRPGESRNTMLTDYSDPEKKGPQPNVDMWPDDINSKKPNQQYSDFIKSKLYRNDRLLVACTDCHNTHGGTPYRRLLNNDPDDSSSPLCQKCHAIDIIPHMENRFGAKMKGQLTRCIDCHMPGTAIDMQGGSYGGFIKIPPYNSSAEEDRNVYWEGHINSHTFKVPFKNNVGVVGIEPGKAMFIPYVNKCGGCHFVYKLPYK
ncbi:MAG: hypothetical protein OIN88_09145 [Candidatus Methanoperedens sp.]|nr:hypothetical protein [Candidatus Methanoperedens sp.]MCZ7361542.1 hypothetical protein [Candidatus Methanoperedens sp.]